MVGTVAGHVLKWKGPWLLAFLLDSVYSEHGRCAQSTPDVFRALREICTKVLSSDQMTALLQQKFRHSLNLTGENLGL